MQNPLIPDLYPLYHRPLAPIQRVLLSAPPPATPRSFARFSTEEAKQMNGEDGAELPYDQIVGLKMSERLSYATGEKSIEFFQKVYRVSEKSL